MNALVQRGKGNGRVGRKSCARTRASRTRRQPMTGKEDMAKAKRSLASYTQLDSDAELGARGKFCQCIRASRQMRLARDRNWRASQPVSQCEPIKWCCLLLADKFECRSLTKEKNVIFSIQLQHRATCVRRQAGARAQKWMRNGPTMRRRHHHHHHAAGKRNQQLMSQPENVAELRNEHGATRLAARQRDTQTTRTTGCVYLPASPR